MPDTPITLTPATFSAGNPDSDEIFRTLDVGEVDSSLVIRVVNVTTGGSGGGGGSARPTAGYLYPRGTG